MRWSGRLFVVAGVKLERYSCVKTGVAGCRATWVIDARQGLQRGTLIPEAEGTVVSDGLLHSPEARASHHLRPHHDVCDLLQQQGNGPALYFESPTRKPKLLQSMVGHANKGHVRTFHN